MKKLMIAAAIVCAATFANAAAALTWATAGFSTAGGQELLNGGQAYLVMVTDAANFAVADNLTVTGGAIIDSVAFADGMAYGTFTDTKSELIGGSTYYFATILTTDGAGISVPTTGYYGLDLNGANETASGFYEVTWDASTGGGFAPNWGPFMGADASTAVAAVPEPTSGLLLLLGVAGLALKRRRA